MKQFIYIPFVLLLIACGGSKKAQEAALAEVKSTENKVEVTATETSDVKEQKLFYFKRGACFGTCPIFNLTIYPSGDAVYIGEMHVDKVGQYEKNIGKEKVNELIKAFNDAKFFDFEDEYTAQMTDLPTTYVEFTQEGKTKKVKDYYGAPETLKALEKKLDAVANANGWKKVADVDH